MQESCMPSSHFCVLLGTALLVLRGAPGARGLTIDTAAEPEENPIIDEWGKSDVNSLSQNDSVLPPISKPFFISGHCESS